MKTFLLHNWMLTLLGLLVSCITLPHARADPETWTRTGSMSIARLYHTVTLLDNGKVLVVGGQSADGSSTSTLASAELYDPATGVWTSTGSMSGVRAFHTATLLANGKVLVAGGSNNGGLTRLASAEVYDPATGVWTNTGSMSSARYDHRAILLANGKVLVAGGVGNDYLSSAELYDPTTGMWTIASSMNSARTDHTATLLANGKVLVAGGRSIGARHLSSAELYDPVTGLWTITGLMGSKRVWHTATLLTNGKVLVSGGNDGDAGNTSAAELYDPATGGWTSTGSMNSKRWFHGSTLLANGKILVAGGGDPTFRSVEIYDPKTEIWTGTAAMNDERSSHEAIPLTNGKVLAVGGYLVNGGTLSSAELYDPGSTITLAAAAHGAITGNLSPYSFNTNATLSATPTPGYIFTGWTGDASGTDNPLSVLMNSDKTIGATFSPDTSDPDDDGRTNFQEIVEIGSNPNLPDTDGDTADDGDDAFPLDPAEALDTDADGTGDNADLDDDGDGLPDADELTVHGTNPKRADSDGDGLRDKDELEVHFTNPLNADHDGDGLSDGAEFLVHQTELKDPDSDDDGFLDGYEVVTGKLPLDAVSRPALVAEARTSIELTFPTALGRSYRIEASTDLATWTVVETGIAGSGGQIQRFYTTRNLPKRYFRVEEEEP